METIKFRGKDHQNQWVFGDLHHKRFTAFATHMIEDAAGLGSDVRPETIGLFSGEKDIDGVEIYNGDIFHMGDINILYVVEWLDCGLKGRQVGNKSCVGLTYWRSKIKVIGNIHDNPELLR